MTASKMTLAGKEFHPQLGKEVRVGMHPEAAEAWEAEYAKLCISRPGFVGELTARGSCQVLRLALLYALLDLTVWRAEDPKTIIRLNHLHAALAVWRYSVASVELLFRKKSGDTLADRLYELLPDGVRMRTTEFYKHVASKGDDIHAMLEQMERNGLIERQEVKGKRGRPATYWQRVDDSSKELND
jgi:hypothetical protein